MKCRKFEYPSAQRGQFNAGVLKEVCKTLRNIWSYSEYVGTYIYFLQGAMILEVLKYEN